MNPNDADHAGDVSEAADDPAGAPGFVAAYAEHFARLNKVVAGMGFGRSDAEDILQDVFIEAMNRPGRYDGPQQASGWLTRVTVNRCLMEHRRRRRFRRAITSAAPDRPESNGTASDAAGGLIRAEEVDAMRDALRELDGLLLAPLVLRYFCDLNSTQIGEALELPPGTVRSRLKQARTILATRLAQRGIGP